MRGAVCEEYVFLRIVEVGLAELDARVGFCARDVDGALVDAVVFETGLEKDTLGVDGGEV